MSLIFKALQSFGSPGADPQSVSEKATSKPRRTGLRKVLFSSPVIIGAAAFIFVVGFLASRLMNWLPDSVSHLPQAVEAASPNGGAPLINESAVQASSGKVSYAVHSPREDASSPLEHLPQVSHPVENDPTEAKELQPEGGESSPEIDLAVQSIDPPASTLNPQDDPPPKPKMLSLLTRDASGGTEPAVADREDAAPPSAAVKETHGGDHREFERQAFQADRHLKISQLTGRIHSAIVADDVRLSNDLLVSLALLKGADNPFVLKLKAYAFIRQERLDEARALLSSVLSQSVDDLDASLNMAVIDIKSGQLAQARSRLIKLRELFPENNHITAYLRQLPPL